MADAGHGKLAVLISGRGSNLGAFIDACATGALDAQIGIVISNKPDAPGLALASAAGIPTAVVNHRDYPDRESFDAELVSTLAGHDPDLVILAGFMRILTPVFVEAFQGRLMNIHPSLLPKYPGLNTHQRALDNGDTLAGVTVHFVTLELDGGPPIVQAQVPVEAGDNAQRLAARVNREELVIYPLAARWFLQGRLRLTRAGAELDGEALPPTGVIYREELLAPA
ncbi:MAG: phosphoribosylglycinamide formyltransferase [Halioglobus sp.]|nr:phosphoribosylglycinamide formyltransferase [Halioglobus sp.]